MLKAEVAVPSLLNCNFVVDSPDSLVVHDVRTLNRSGDGVASYDDCMLHTKQLVDLLLLFRWLLLKLCVAFVCVIEIGFVVMPMIRLMMMTLARVELTKYTHRQLQAIDTSRHDTAMCFLG